MRNSEEMGKLTWLSLGLVYSCISMVVIGVFTLFAYTDPAQVHLHGTPLQVRNGQRIFFWTTLVGILD